ncbi:16S rRNA (cytosine(967)-C(5))-methyltransferase RsmB [Phosphitispora sp. TUW77]|uniref:16S rRNA (cytosine(967)-C(5))-methyltransferase RsmB n=1 Tax=Phosphitispora sp. TUW77 TaxID=3152361 RepID=UPI003AB61C9E
MKKKSARSMALEVLYSVDHDGAYSNIALNGILEKYQPEKTDRGFITELVYGTLRRLGTIDWVLGRFLKKPLDTLPVWIKNILRMGVYQILHLEKVPDSAACNESVNLAKNYGHPGTVKLVNGVLRNVVRSKDSLDFPDIVQDPVKGIAVRYSHPEWLVSRWVDEFGAGGAEELCRADNEVPPNAIRTNTLKTTRDELQQLLEKEGVCAVSGKFAPESLIIEGFRSVGSLAAHRSGLFMVQDESSTLVGHALSPKPGSFVIDACSAPGGKSAHLAQLMGNRGQIISVDVHPHKIKLIEENASRLGITIINPLLYDAMDLDRRFAGAADYVLVDAPCSGLGVLRRRPEIRWRKEPRQIAELHALQVKILHSAAACLKPGGILVYSTCTMTHEENIDTVREFLDSSAQFQMESLTGFLPGILKNLKGTDTMDRGYVQFFPHIHGIDGFFISRLKKQA